MPFGKGRRKWFWAVGCLLVGVTVVWFALPVWFPWALRPLAARVGARFSGYERVGYGRFGLDNLTLTNESTIIHVGRAEALVPSVWLWALATTANPAATRFLKLDNWSCQVLPSRSTNSSPPFAQVQDLAEMLRWLQRWVPAAILEHGRVLAGKTSVDVPDASWTEGRLMAALVLSSVLPGRVVQASISPARPFALKMDCAALELASAINITTNQAGLDLNGWVGWQTNRGEVEAHFGLSDVIPQTARLQATHLDLAGATVQLPEYQTLVGAFLAQWNRGQFALDLRAHGTPTVTQTNLPAVALELHATGDTHSLSLDKLIVQAPFVQARLSNPAQFAFSAPYLEEPAHLAIAADLSRQHWLPVTGHLSGALDVTRGIQRLPTAELRVTGTNIGSDSLHASALDVLASFNWPHLELARADIRFDDGSHVSLTGAIDLENKSVTNGNFRFASPLVTRWMPAGYSYQKLAVSGTFHGPMDRIAHAGNLEAARVTTPLFRPLTVHAQWRGEAETLNEFRLRLSSTNSSLTLQGALTASQRQTELRLSSLTLDTNGLPALELTQPIALSVQRRKSGASWLLETSPLRWAGPGGEVAGRASVQWPDRGLATLSIQNVALATFDGLVQKPLPEIAIKQMEGVVDWTNGPVRLGLDLSATERILAQPSEPQSTPAHRSPSKPSPDTAPSSQPSPGSLLATPLQLELSLRGDSRGILLSNLAINSATSAVVVARGALPLTLNPASTHWVHLESRQRLELQASVRPEAFFWRDMAKWTGLHLQDPDLNLNVAGTWDTPQGQLTLRARRVQMDAPALQQLTLEDLRFGLKIDRQQARVTEGQLLIQGQRLTLSGQLPLGEGAWQGLLQKRIPDLRQATAQLQMNHAHLAAFEPLFPKLLAPQGELSLDLRVLAGARLEGALEVRDARTRPLGNTAPFRDINVTLRFHNRLLSLENASANLSGAPIDLAGRVDLRGTNWLAGGLPTFALTVRGTNVPLAREPEYIIRSDLDLAIIKTNEASPLIFGAAHLRDSFFLSDLSALVPGGVAKPSSRPPYFSIDNPLLANWRLAVTVDGVRWLKVRTSLFNGEITANLHLQGTLKDPIALGGLSIDSGIVRFPFGNLQVQQGLVTLGSQNPYQPQLMVRANSKQFGYDIHMEVTGTADTPVIQFTSNPPLSSEQILLMITAGQLPQGMYSLTPQQRAETMALFLGRDLLAKLGLGDQTQERLTIRSGEEISETGRPTYHVEYKFAKHWFIVGEYDRFGDYNAGFKWRVYSK